jgi:hypothetical protein
MAANLLAQQIAQDSGTVFGSSDPEMATSPNERKLRQLVITLAGQLADAQFARADQPRVERLWREVAALEIDPERITRLLYGGQDVHDREGLAEMDRQWTKDEAAGAGGGRRPQRVGRPWLRRPWPAAGRRNAPPAAAPARH